MTICFNIQIPDIAQQFVTFNEKNGVLNCFLKAAIAMKHLYFKRKVVAGIETVEQLKKQVKKRAMDKV